MLDQIRKLSGYTQEDLAKKIGITQSYYTQIETGSSKSSPVISKLSKALKIRESFLTSLGEYTEYPFLSNFYVFYLTEQRIVQSYKFVIDYICSKSRYIDAIFFLMSRADVGISPYPLVTYIALRDDHDTVFLFKRRVKIFRLTVTADRYRRRKEVESRIFRLVDIFREELHKMRTPYVYERTVLIPRELYEKIEKNNVKGDDIVSYFQDTGYFKGLYKAHTELKKR